MAKLFLTAALAAVMALSTAAAQPTGKVDKDSQKFIEAAIEGNFAEIDIGKLAQKKGTSDAVKQFGAMLVKGHSAANEKATAVAKQLNLTPPNRSSIAAKAKYLKLEVLSGETFDSSFAEAMVKDHENDIKEYQTEAQKNDPAGEFAKQTLPTLQKHLQEAQSLVQQTHKSSMK